MKEATYETFLDALPNRSAGGALLDVGCAHGYLLAAARSRGFDVHGVEPSPPAAAAAREELGAERIHEGMLGPEAFPGRVFDVITLIDVFEHVPDPAAFLSSVRERLAPGGVALLVLPNAASLVARVLGGRWPHLAGEHLFHWSPASFERFLTERGFSVEAVRTGVRKTFTTSYLTSYASVVGAWLPPGLGLLPNVQLRIPTGEMLALVSPEGDGAQS